MMAGTQTRNDNETRIGAVVGAIPSGLFVLTAAGRAGRETGMLASWVQQASFAPPMITVAVNKERYLNNWLDEVPRLAVSLLGESQREVLKYFAKGFRPEEPAFGGVDIFRGATGLPVLRQAIGYLEGNIAGRLECGDHAVYAVEVTGGGLAKSVKCEQPMVHIRKNGFHY